MKILIVMMGVCALAGAQEVIPKDWQKARDAQDRAALDKIAADAESQAAAKAADGALAYKAALAQSTRSAVAMEMGDKRAAASAAEAGIRLMEKVASDPRATFEAHRLMGTLCGQVIPANVLLGLKYGQCALEEVEKALKMEPKSARVWLSRGVGNYYLPASFGGGAEIALKDMDKAIELNAAYAEAHLWRGIALRKLGKNAEARVSLEKALKLNPARVWAKQQLEKTPAQ